MKIKDGMMKRSVILVVFLTSIICIFNKHSQKDDFPILKGPYLGQMPPGVIPKIFAPGIVSTENNEALFGFFESNTRLLFSRTEPGFNDWKNEPVYLTELKEGRWSEPRLSSHIGEPWYLDIKPFPPGEVLIFARWGGNNGIADPKNLDLWKVTGTSHGWSDPRKLPPPINSDTIDTFPSVSKDKTLYFFSGRKEGIGGDDIYLSRLENGQYSKVENPGPEINSIFNDIDPQIAPDGSFLIFCSDRLEGLGKTDIYVSFKRKDGLWTSAVNMGKEINSVEYDWIPYISNDGKYLFFVSNRTGNDDIYWVEAKIVEILKHEAMNSAGNEGGGN